jgi:type IV pilus assembly protein PilB
MFDITLESYLFDNALINAEQLSYAKNECERTGAGFIPLALEERLLSFEMVSNALLQLANINTADLMGPMFDAETAKILSHSFSLRHHCIPIKKEGERLWVAFRDPLDGTALAGAADVSGMFVEPMLAAANDILYAVNAVFGQEERQRIASQFASEEGKATAPRDAKWQTLLANAPAVRFISSLIETGVLHRASDIHIEPYSGSLRARYRVDGQLFTCETVDAALLPNVISRLKVLGGLDIAEKRMPQDGHFNVAAHGQTVDIRLSTLPTLHGEKAALRLLYDHTARIKKDALGFFPEDIERLDALFSQPYGAIFMTGPTGSGKSTTLNCFLEGMNTENINITTIEDPVENPLPGINHTNIAPAAGLGFANALKHILRQDPDVIMVGEIRDAETAGIAVQAALTGHLVLSTLHTNDAAGVIERLADMRIEPYLAAAALNGVIAQRLVRRICPHCKEKHTLSASEALLLHMEKDAAAFAGKGCARCGNTGYKGRFAVYEYIVMDESLRRDMSGDPGRFAASLRERRQGMRANGVRNIREGNTTAAEIIRALYREL